MSHQLDKYDLFMKILEIIEQEQTSYLTYQQLQKAGIVIEKFEGVLVQQQAQIENIQGDKIMGDKPTGEQRVEVLLGDNATIYGDFVVAHSIRASFNKAASAGVSDELRELLKDLTIAVGKMTQEMPGDNAEEVAEDMKTLVEQATREKPKRKWWSVSVEGLTQAAKNIGKIGEPVTELLERIVPILIRLSA